MQWQIGRIADIDNKCYEEIYLNLSASRKAHIDKMKKEDAKKSSLLATHIMNCLLEKSGTKNAILETDEKGRPYLKGSDMFISISHSCDMVACAIDNKPIGIDIEKIKPVTEKFIKFVCTESEQEYILDENLTDSEKSQRFFEIWTAKEAVFKQNETASGIRAIDTMNMEKQTFTVDGYQVTIVI